MTEKEKVQIRILDEIHEYDSGTSLEAVSRDFQSRFPHRIILARVNGRLRELCRTVTENGEIEFVSVGEKAGEAAYRRTATLILTKAVSDILGADARLIVQFSVHRGYYCEIIGHMPIEEELLKQIQRRMEELVEANLPIAKQTVNTYEAQKIFKESGMEEKGKLFKYRRASRVNIYQLENISDYYYGYMAPSTGYVSKFELIAYHEGFVIQMPVAQAPEVIQNFRPSEKLFGVLKESTIWGERLGICNTGQLNDRIADGGFLDLMLVAEALQEKNIGDIADEIYASGKRIVLIAGPSSSGKTTFSHRLSVQLRAKGLKPHPIAVDDYFVDRELTPKDADGNYNYECLEALNIEQFNKDLMALLRGEQVEIPKFNFVSGKSEYGKNNFLRIGREDVLVIEGIHCLNDELTYTIPMDDKYRVYISALTQLNLDEHNRIATTDGRLIRRIVRDAAHRGASAAHTISMWNSVRRGEEANIFPFQENADALFNSALIYELSVLKQFAEPLLFGIKPEQPEYEEAKRLLKFLDYFVGVTSENIPKNSILREFIGGSYFNV
ncbi:nucleoside kinase [Frisingicoccus sp.]|uniref:nucleoside kinase n=1 Tax=Frisingicoccus sp. TaxID=1918627 RepID=UPI002E7929B0|nr:nucleoside kinase [Frisingicoccus sp.]MEE0751299.1 nucleoside kinase [Frisingicoccus sp.]